MPKYFKECDESVRAQLDGLIAQYRRDLIAADASIALLFAYGDEGKPALKHRGQVVLGSCKINSLQDRIEGKSDATIVLDGDRYPQMSTRRQLALLHHELSHIARWDVDEHGTDDLDRPALKSQYADFEFDGFHEVIRLYGDDSIEVANLRSVAEEHRQLGLPFSVVAAEGDSPLIRDTFTALLSVGHTESQARHVIDRVMQTRKKFNSVSEMIDAIYNLPEEVA